ncbi:hypothetical protein MXD63_33410 [Frankia sp. Cpl3]|uniref:hypothetical protein n=1 Tax=Parafrankia colletiae TaxID=573497 RepID=UPI000A049694|nr:hypothetical protein [Parafrankia colletiae]MCK9904917.1 hypothetical protein [Frankia sp. Cpl3]
MVERKKILLRLDPAVHDALARWASDELRSTNAQIEHLLRAALAARGRLPRDVGAIPRRGRPRNETETRPVAEPVTETEPEPEPGIPEGHIPGSDSATPEDHHPT